MRIMKLEEIYIYFLPLQKVKKNRKLKPKNQTNNKNNNKKIIALLCKF